MPRVTRDIQNYRRLGTKSILNPSPQKLLALEWPGIFKTQMCSGVLGPSWNLLWFSKVGRSLTGLGRVWLKAIKLTVENVCFAYAKWHPLLLGLSCISSHQMVNKRFKCLWWLVQTPDLLLFVLYPCLFRYRDWKTEILHSSNNRGGGRRTGGYNLLEKRFLDLVSEGPGAWFLG